MEQQRRPNLFLPMVLLLVLFCYYAATFMAAKDTISYTSYESYLEKGQITAAIIYPNAEVPTGKVVITCGDASYTVNVVDVNTEKTALEEKGIAVEVGAVQRENRMTTIVFPMLLGILLLGFLFMSLQNRAMSGGGSNSKMMNFGKSRAKKDDGTNPVKFDDVAGLQEEKEDLEELVDFLKAPGKYTSLGARIPKGVLLVGPPGTGKTLLAKAVAGEAGVPFFSISGSDFVEMFVGVGASRVRDLFQQAKQNAPCIVFIDEIDAVARRRGAGMGGGHDEREQTLNQMLVEMDGFGVNEGIIVLAATNRVDILDPAIMRPGRFDRKVGVGRPDIKGREEILKVHSNKKPLGDDVDLHKVAATTAGFSGADLENLMNEAAIKAAKDNRSFITAADINEAFIKVGIGAEKRSKVMSDKAKRITAYHESGHAILFHVLPDTDPVHTVSIIPTGMGAAGYTMPEPGEDQTFTTKNQMLQDIMVAMGGRIAEDIIFKDVTTGASQDIKQATSTARSMVTKYGMTKELGMVNYAGEDDEVFLGRDYGHTKMVSETTASQIDEEVKKIIDACYKEAYRIIESHRDVLEASANLLLENEKISGEEFAALFGEGDHTEIPKLDI